MSIAYKDYYAILGVARDATQEDIKKAFRKLARQYHPDVAASADKAAAEVKFKEINEAHEVLGDPEKRSKYDQLGADWERAGAAPPPGGGAGYGGYGGYGGGGGGGHGQGGGGGDAGGGYSEQEFHFGGTGFSDFFEQYFSGATPFGFPPHGGGEEEFESGSARRGQPRPRRGSDVEGDILVTLEEAMHGTVRPLTLQMLNRRTGQTEARDFQVRIPPGATDGRRIRVPGQGEPGQNGGPDGDLFLRVRHAAHPDFTSEGADLYHELDIAPWEAVLGTEVVVPTLGGSVKLRIPAGSENGQNLRLRNRGLPKGKSGDHGDFFVVLKVTLPPAPAGEERQLWEKLRDISTFRPRSHS